MQTVKNMKAKGTIRLEGTVVVQRGQPMLLTAMRAEDLGRHKKVDVYDPTTKTGYQRTSPLA